MPDKLRDLQEAWIEEASRYNVFPLDDTGISRFVSLRPNYTPGRTVFTYAGELANVPFPGTAGAPNMLKKSLHDHGRGRDSGRCRRGVLVTDGGHFGGYGFYLLKGRPVFCWNLVQLALVKWQRADVVAPGRHVLEFDWKYDGPRPRQGRRRTLKVDGVAVDSHPMPKSLPIGIGWCETFCVGVDTGTAVDESDYQVPFRFTGKINKLTMALGPEELTPAEREMIYNTYRDK